MIDISIFPNFFIPRESDLKGAHFISISQKHFLVSIRK
jgi:hypothetical protein